jgi:hypothetical protein
MVGAALSHPISHGIGRWIDLQSVSSSVFLATNEVLPVSRPVFQASETNKRLVFFDVRLVF